MLEPSRHAGDITGKSSKKLAQKRPASKPTRQYKRDKRLKCKTDALLPKGRALLTKNLTAELFGSLSAITAKA